MTTQSPPNAWLHRMVDLDAVAVEYPPPPVFLEQPLLFEPEASHARKLERLRVLIERAWETEFYRRLWQPIGFEPGDLKDVDDVSRLPAYTVDDLRESLDRKPPWGEHHRLDPWTHGASIPFRAYFSGGTTGRARPVLYTPHDRAVHSIMQARALYLQRVRPGDIVINAWQYGLHQAAWVLDEALYRWLGAMPLTASTGNVTSSEKQLHLARDFRAAALLTTGDYLLHLARTATEIGMDIEHDFSFRYFPTAGAGQTDAIERAWGRPAYDCYGTYDLSTCAAECEAKDGLHIWDDAFIMDIVDIESGLPLDRGETGNLVVTSLYMEAFPIVRYNTMDMTALRGFDRCACGLATTKMEGFKSRSDTMVKLRGVNVWPEAIGRIVTAFDGATGEYFCVVERIDERDVMTVKVEVGEPSEALGAAMAAKLKSQTDVRITVETVPPRSLDELTGKGRVAKLRRLSDLRRDETLRPD